MNTPHHLHRSIRSSRRGFTLMEMIIVLSIIALLMGLVIMNLSPITGIAQDRKARADIQALKVALSAYQLQTGSYPTQEQGLKALWAKPTTEPVPDNWRPVMEEEVLDPWNHPYQYSIPGKHNPDKYDVFSMGQDGQAGTDDDIGNWSTAKSTASQ
jgi:general secretion pathway protein G